MNDEKQSCRPAKYAGRWGCSLLGSGHIGVLFAFRAEPHSDGLRLLVARQADTALTLPAPLWRRHNS